MCFQCLVLAAHSNAKTWRTLYHFHKVEGWSHCPVANANLAYISFWNMAARAQKLDDGQPFQNIACCMQQQPTAHLSISWLLHAYCCCCIHLFICLSIHPLVCQIIPLITIVGCCWLSGVGMGSDWVGQNMWLLWYMLLVSINMWFLPPPAATWWLTISIFLSGSLSLFSDSSA